MAANGSFVPVRSHCTAKWFVGGETYMAAVADAIEKAQHEILITDWMLSAQIFLKRTTKGVPSLDDPSRLDNMLIKKADEGVKVFLLIFHGELKVKFPLLFTKYILDLGNKEAKKVLNHKNIVFILDPTVKLDLSLNIIWSHHEKLVVVDQTLAFVSGIDLCYGRWDNHRHRLTDNYEKPLPEETAEHEDIDSDVQFQTWIGLDYMNDFKESYTHDDFENPFTDYIDRSKNPRLPWHDIGCCVHGQVAKDVAKHFKQRYEYSKTYQNISEYKDLDPATNIDSPGLIITDPSTSNCSCQVLRSASNWSAGIDETEHSIQNAYISAIENAEYYVYIENQFFISSLDFESLKVTNGIAKAIKDRIARAYKEKKKFHVILVIPLKPEFTGKISGSDNSFDNITDKISNPNDFSMQEVLNGEMLTISHKKCSIIERLIAEDGIPKEEISEYFSVYGLRTYDYNEKGIPITEIVYVHAKCMIVDDKITIIGSANVNDRSMEGYGDSEVVVQFQDETFVDSYMNGVPYKAGEFAQSLRLNLFREHLGIAPGDNDLILDPLSDKFYKAWKNTARTNDDIFLKVFGGDIVPCEGVRTYKQLDEHKKKIGLAKTDVSQAKILLKEVKGNLSEFPLYFLADTDMSVFGSWRETWSIFGPINRIFFLAFPDD